MLPICPKCGKEVMYVSSSTGDRVYMVEPREKQLISKMGRVLIGYPEHNCTIPDKTVEVVDDAEKDTGQDPGR
jgi:hypothetical protein